MCYEVPAFTLTYYAPCPIVGGEHKAMMQSLHIPVCPIYWIAPGGCTYW